jgi:hypothetical protein
MTKPGRALARAHSVPGTLRQDPKPAPAVRTDPCSHGLADRAETASPFAMQKVEGSSPFIRFPTKAPPPRGFRL